MKKKTNFIWLYSILLFSASLLLILISTLSQSRLSPSDAVMQENEQQAFNQTIQKSMTDLVRENESLRIELKDANEKLDSYKSENENFSNNNIHLSQSAEANEFLISAEMYFNIGQYANSRNTLQNVNIELLSEKGRELFHWMREKLERLGYKLEG